MPKTNDLAVALSLAVTQERIFATQLAVRQSDELLRHIAKLMVGTGARSSSTLNPWCKYSEISRHGPQNRRARPK